MKEQWAAKRKTIRPQVIDMTREGLVTTGLLTPDSPLPLVVQPKIAGVGLSEWARDNRDFIDSSLLQHGGILFRGFETRTQEEFKRFLDATQVELMHYMEGATPRFELSSKLYTSTEFPPEHSIQLHNELCYVTTWPMKIWFFCLQAAEQGGATPIGDVRKVYERIDREVREKFIEKGWLLVRNFNEGLGLSWQTSFRATDKSAVEDYFRRAQIDFEWRAEGHLMTRQVRPAIARHPRSGELVWFNHIGFWHLSSLEPRLREILLSEFGEEGLPYNTYYGDGSPIEAEVVAHLRDAYQAETVSFPWQNGDVLMLDNMLVAHGRAAFSGIRKVLAAMGEPFSNRGI